MIYSRLDEPGLWNAAERHPTAATVKRRAKCPTRDGQKLEIFKFCAREQLASRHSLGESGQIIRPRSLPDRF